MKLSVAAILISLTSVSGFNSYLGNLSQTTAPAKAAPVVYKEPQTTGLSYLDNLKPTTARQGGSGLTGYLDALKGGAAPAPAAPAPVAPAPVAPAPAAPVKAAPAAAVASSTPAPAAGDYLSSLLTNAPVAGGAGLQGYLSTLPSNTASGGAGFQGYLSVLKVNAAGSSGAGLRGYTDALACNSSGKTALVGGASSSSMAAFLESVYKQIQSLPASSKTQVGNSVSFTATANGMAMAFVKN
jgi:hypothetical protein